MLNKDVPFCQSCGMSMKKTEDFGTNADGPKKSEYCHFCFQNRKFTDQNITMEQMIHKVAGFAKQMNMSEEQAREMARTFIPKLKRWQGK